MNDDRLNALAKQQEIAQENYGAQPGDAEPWINTLAGNMHRAKTCAADALYYLDGMEALPEKAMMQRHEWLKCADYSAWRAVRLADALRDAILADPVCYIHGKYRSFRLHVIFQDEWNYLYGLIMRLPHDLRPGFLHDREGQQPCPLYKLTKLTKQE